MPDAQPLHDRTYSEDILERAAQRIEWPKSNETDIASAEALVSIGQTLKSIAASLERMANPLQLQSMETTTFRSVTDCGCPFGTVCNSTACPRAITVTS